MTTPLDNGNKSSHSSSRSATLMGFVAVLIWGTTVAFSRTLSEQIGIFTSGTIIFLGGGLLSTGFLIFKDKKLSWLKNYSIRYLLLCGGLFIIYEVFFYLAIGYSVNHQQVLEVGLINYLWIGFTFLFSVPILKKHAHWTLLLGLIIAIIGVIFATLTSDYSLSAFQFNLQHNLPPYFFALSAAVSWGLFSTLGRKLAPLAENSAVPLFFIAAGLVLFVIRMLVPEKSVWDAPSIFQVAYCIIFPIVMAHIFWDISMRRGNMIRVTTVSYLIPLISTLVSSWILNTPLTINIIGACVLVITGAVICNVSVTERQNRKQ